MKYTKYLGVFLFFAWFAVAIQFAGAQTFSELMVGQKINAHIAALGTFLQTQTDQSIINEISRRITNFLNDVSAMDSHDSASLRREWTALYMDLKSHVAADPLSEGDRGLSVSILQSVLREDASIYPEGLVTGFFGPMTRNAVMNLQAREELPVTGIVDELTLRKLAAISWPKLSSELNLHLR